MKNSTFSAQVANNLLTLLQGYSKTIRLLLVMFLTLTVTTNVWGAEYSYTFSAKQFSANGSKTLNSVSWTLAGDGGYWGYDATKGQQFGSGGSPYKTLTLSTSGISGTIKQIKINTSGASSVNASFTVSVGGTQYGSSTKLTTTATEYTFTGSKSGEIKFSYTQTSSKALYIKSISVTYETAAATVPVTGVSLDKTKLTLTEGSSETLTATVSPNNATDKTVTWTTNKSSVATVSYGKVTAVAEGSAIITVTTKDGNKTATCSVTVNPKPKYTVTLVPGSGSVPSTTLTESSAGAGVDLPTPTICDGWTFAGWATSAVATETSSKPATLLTGSYKPSSNTTLYAVYQRKETTQGGGGTQDVSNKYTFADYTAGTQYAEGEEHELDDVLTLTTTQCHFTTELRIYSSDSHNGYVVSNKLPGRISSIGFNAGNKLDAIDVYGSTDGTDWTKVGQVSVTSTSYKDYTLSFGETNYTYFKLDVAGANQVRLKSITITWESTSAGGTITTTYYHSTPDCGGSTPDPDPIYYTITLNPNYPEGKKGTFIDTVGNAVDGDLKISWLGETKTTPIANLYSSISLDGYIFEGWYEITAEGEKNRKNTGTITSDTTFYARWKVPYTVTFDPGTGSCDKESITETTANGITLPTATLEDCGNWVFLGWAENAIASETTTAPASILYGGSTYKPTANITLYAIYKRVEGGGSGEGAEATLSFADKAQRTYQDGNKQVWEQNGITLTNNKAESTSAVGDYANPARFYKSSEIIISAPGTITKIVATTSGSEYTTALANSVGGATSSNNIVTITPTASSNTYTIQLIGGQVRLNSITVTYGGGLSTSYYHSNPYCQRCENILTISKGVETNGTFTLDISDDIETCETEVSVVVKPIPANHYHIGSVTATTPTTGGAPTVTDNDNGTYTITYAANSTGASTINVTFAENAKATITLYELGVPTTITTEYVGDKYTLPSTSSQSCGTKTLVGWSTVAFAETDTRPTENYYGISTQITLAETQTFYAVFAQSNGGGGGNGDYVKVTEDANDLSGEYLIVYEEGNLAFNGGLTTLDAASNTISVTIDDNTIESTDATDAAKFTITKNGDAYIITSASNYHIGQTSDANGLQSSTSTSYTNTITITEDSANIIGEGGAYLRYNKTSSINNGKETGLRFRYYKSSTYNQQQPIALYKQSGSSASYTDYTTGCHDVTITYYGFTGGYTTNCGGSDLNVIAQRVNSEHTIPNCTEITDPTDLGRTFLNLWKDQNGKEHKPGDSFIVTQDITLYAQWKLETTGDIELPADKEDLATTDIVVTGGKTLTIPEGETITINSLTLKGGLLGEDSKSGYAMPSVVIPDNATLVRKNTTINLDLVVNSDSWYPFAVPFAATNNANVEYLDPTLAAASTYGTHFAIKTYDGARRAEEGVDQTNNWVQLKRNEKLQPGVGYIISAMTYPDKDTATIRIPMSVSNDWLANGELTTVNEVTRNAVEVTAYTGAAATEHQRHAGWNFVANPYLANFAGTNASGSFINGKIIINKGDYSYGGEDVPYVTIPTYNFAHYYQVKLSDATLSPAYSFFVQVGTDGTMTFETAGRQQAPASIAARNAEERPVKMDVDITLSDNHSSDQTGIIISDRYSEAYEIGRDLEKLFGSAYNLSVYTLMADNTPLAFQALAIRSNMQVIPVGYRAPEQGEYTFRLNEATSSIDLLNEQYEQLVLVDYQTGELTNLLIADYTFYSERTQADNRFAIYAVPRQNAPTDLPNAIGQDKQAQKIIHNGHLYILRDGSVYNGNGQIVK